MYKISQLLILLLLVAANKLKAQDKIYIYYDDGGSRVLRERICSGCRPAPPSDSTGINEAVALTSSDDNQQSKQALAQLPVDYKVYPNPANNRVYVFLSNIAMQQSCTILLTDQFGKEHFRQKAKSVQTAIPLEYLSAGTYFVIIYIGDRKETVKVVKE